MKLIDKDAVLAEIEKLLDKGKYHEEYDCAYRDGNNSALYALKGKVNSLEVKEVDFWHKQSEEDIDDSIIGWSMHSFICLMKDGTIQEFTGILDESYEGSINKHLDCVDDNYEWEYDDITYWIEVPNIKAQKGE